MELKAKIKFNGGYGAILCHYCNRILKEGLTDKEWEGESDLLYCNDECKNSDILLSTVAFGG